MILSRALCAPAIAAASLALSGCGTNFDPASLVESVRLLAIAADEPYTQPGDTVTMTALAVDGRYDDENQLRDRCRPRQAARCALPGSCWAVHGPRGTHR